MPQPDSSRNWAQDTRYNDSDRTWPVDPAAPRRFGAPRSAPAPRPKDPDKDGRTPDDKDGNEELEREIEEKPSSRRSATERQSGLNVARREFEHEDTGEWVATERFTLEDELEDTWPNVPARYLDD